MSDRPQTPFQTLRETLEKKKAGLGAAFDIGTTTVVCALVDLSTGEVLGTASAANPQAAWGRDVVSRMEAALGSPGALDGLTGAIRKECSALLDALAGPRKAEVAAAAAAGNSVMEHILLGLSPAPLARVPYRPAFRTAQALEGAALGLGCDTYIFPLIGGFVGGDAVAVALSLGMPEDGAAVLAIDIGTNSEILLSSGGTLYATSAAAGPAFEGGQISSGMIASNGAVRGVAVDGDTVVLDVIGKGAPRGVCGSGLIDAVAALVSSGVIDATGRIRDGVEVSTNLAARIRPGAGGNSFVLYRDAKTLIEITQDDVRALQTAKSATRAGVSMLLMKAGIEPSDIGTVYIAGAFGSHIREGALRVMGLLDESWTDVRAVGDAALDGAVLALDGSRRAAAESIAAGARYVSLSGSAHFEREFMRNMNFQGGTR